jgi:hypothetical protein
MSANTTTTTFTSRGRLTGLIRSEAPASAGQSRTRSAHRTEAGRGADDEALYYRARLILGESLPRPHR